MSRRDVVVLRALERGAFPARRRSRLDRFAYGVVCGVLIGGALFGLGIVRADEEGDAPRYSPTSRGGRVAVQELAEQHFAPEWVGWAVNTARCESGWNLYAYSAGFDRRWGVFYEHVGALQVDGVTWRRVAEGDLLDPAVNFAVAAYVLSQQGTRAWPWCGR